MQDNGKWCGLSRQATGLGAAILAIALGWSTPVRAICDTCCRGAPPRCTSPDGPGHRVCEDGAWGTCVADDVHVANISVLPSYGIVGNPPTTNASVNNGLSSGGGEFFLGVKDPALSLFFSAVDTNGISSAYAGVTYRVLCGKAADNSVGTWSSTYLGPFGAQTNATHASGSRTVSFSGSAPLLSCPGGAQPDELELDVTGYLTNSLGQSWQTPTVIVRLIGTIKVMTYNIRHGSSASKTGWVWNGSTYVPVDCSTEANGNLVECMDQYEQMNVIVAQRPDILLMQEVDVGQSRSNYLNEPLYYSSDTRWPMRNAFFPEWSGGEYGDAILSRFPYSNAVTHDVPFRMYDRGQLGELDIQLNQFTIQAMTLHFDRLTTCSDQHGANQVVFTCAVVKNNLSMTSPSAILFGGDFNSHPDPVVGSCNADPKQEIGLHTFLQTDSTCTLAPSSWIAGLLPKTEYDNSPGIQDPRPTIDNIIVYPQNLSVLNSWTVPGSLAASDHWSRVSVLRNALAY
jgi:endonuclease/exonuclease/phosphatase family metal-dependent hydrolase